MMKKKILITVQCVLKNMDNLTKIYEPETPDDIYGHPTAIKNLKKWADGWSQGDKPQFLHGPAGTGKSSTAQAIANYAGWGYEEINASSHRRKEDIEHLVQQIRSISENKRLFVFDEVDSVNGNSLSSLYKIMDDSPNPMIFIANEKWKVPDGITNNCNKHKFNLGKDSIKKFLNDVIEEQGIDISNREIGQLSTRNGIRDALNDLEEYIESGETGWDDRDTEDSPFAVTRRIILNNDYIGDMKPDDTVEFLNENLRKEYDGVEAMRAYQAIAEADKWLGEVQETQDYSWWRHAGMVANEVSNIRLTEPYNNWVNVNYPGSRRNYTQTIKSDTKEAQLFREIFDKRNEEYVASFNFQEFRNIVLPIIKDLDSEEKKQIALSYSLSNKAMGAMGLSKTEYESWEVKESSGKEKENGDLSDYVDSNNSSDDDNGKGLFDY